MATGTFITFTVTTVTNTQTMMQLHDETGNALVGATGTYTTPLVWSPDTAGRYYLSASPEDGLVTFGCVSEAGYDLVLTMEEVNRLYLPLVTNKYNESAAR